MRTIKLLLIDDDEDDFVITRDLLNEIRTLDFQLDWADNPESGREMLRQNEHDVCLLDHELGIEDGVTLLKQSSALGFSGPVIMLTGQDSESLDEQAQQAGAVDYLVKNHLNASRLARAIRYAISRREMERERLERIKAETDNRYKSEFLAHLSHELRTPLTAILGYCDLILHQTQERGIQENLLVIKRNGNHLLSLLNDVLDLSKIEAGKLELDMSSIELPAFVEDVAQLMRVYALDKGIDFRVSVDPALPECIYTDITRLKQILLNLLSNAIKFTHQGNVSLAVVPGENQGIRFEVSDTGIGIAPEDLKKLFRPFTQAGSRNRGIHQGTGLGLAICKKLVERLGGEISVSSSPGSGSRFSFELPSSVGEVTPSDTGKHQEKQTQKDYPAVLQLTGRVLVTDDLEDIRKLIGTMVSNAGADVDYAASGEDAIDKFRSARESGKPFDLLIMDIQMPGIDGIEATRKIREMDSGVPIIALTAAIMQGDKEKGLGVGINEYQGKPINAKKLITTLARYLPARDSETLQPDTILLVEDNPDARQATALLIEHLGYEVMTASDGASAMEKARSRRPGVILLDINLPDQSGFDVARYCRDLLPHSRIIALSGEHLAKDRIDNSAFDGFQLKPISLERLKGFLSEQPDLGS
ncbi:MAG: response regulator [Ketobacteraceae bacterium]|nr:response regulator [Ketobacteraceae bacterium]